MSRIVWDEPGNRLYETGIDRGVFYPLDGGLGVPWNGLVAVAEAPSGADIRKDYYDGELFRQQRQSESFSAVIKAYSYPVEFSTHEGSSLIGHTTQRRKPFGLSYRTRVANDLNSEASYLIHLVYNAVVSPTQRSYRSVGAGVDPTTFEWNLNTVPEFLPDGQMSAHIIVNPAIAYPWALKAFEDILYGTPASNPRMPSILEVVNLFENASLLRITDNLDGTWTADGPNDAITVTLSDWIEKRRNIFRDPFAKTTNSFFWSSTGGSPTTVVDPDGISWARFTRQAAGNVRLADIKGGSLLYRDKEYRFIFKLRSSYLRTVNLVARTAVTNSADSVSAGTVLLEPNKPTLVDVVVRMPNTYESTLAGMTIIHNGSVVGDTLDVTGVSIEDISTARRRMVHGNRGAKTYSRYRWLGVENESYSVYEERDEIFQITWPSAVYIDTDRYRVSSL